MNAHEVPSMKELMRDCGVFDDAQKEIDNYFDLAIHSIKSNSVIKSQHGLEEIIEMLRIRVK